MKKELNFKPNEFIDFIKDIRAVQKLVDEKYDDDVEVKFFIDKVVYELWDFDEDTLSLISPDKLQKHKVKDETFDFFRTILDKLKIDYNGVYTDK